MVDSNFKPKSKPWRELALRAHFHLATAHLLLDLALDTEPGEHTAAPLRGAQSEVVAAQAYVREIAEVDHAA